MDFAISLGIISCTMVILALSLNLISGYCGQISLGHAAFYGIGAYGAAMATKAGVPFVAALLGGGVLAGVFGILVGFAAHAVVHLLEGAPCALDHSADCATHLVTVCWPSIAGAEIKPPFLWQDRRVHVAGALALADAIRGGHSAERVCVGPSRARRVCTKKFGGTGGKRGRGFAKRRRRELFFFIGDKASAKPL